MWVIKLICSLRNFCLRIRWCQVASSVSNFSKLPRSSRPWFIDWDPGNINEDWGHRTVSDLSVKYPAIAYARPYDVPAACAILAAFRGWPCLNTSPRNVIIALPQSGSSQAGCAHSPSNCLAWARQVTPSKQPGDSRRRSCFVCTSAETFTACACMHGSAVGGPRAVAAFYRVKMRLKSAVLRHVTVLSIGQPNFWLLLIGQPNNCHYSQMTRTPNSCWQNRVRPRSPRGLSRNRKISNQRPEIAANNVRISYSK